MRQVIAFDVFGTVFDLSDVDRREISQYVHHVKDVFNTRGWMPLTIPESWWDLKAHPDAAEGIARLRTKYQVVTCSNGPMRLLTHLSKEAGISWDGIIPIEAYQLYKPSPLAYTKIWELMGVKPEACHMVTANPGFGDVEASTKAGMRPHVIRQPGELADIIALASLLGC